MSDTWLVDYHERFAHVRDASGELEGRWMVSSVIAKIIESDLHKAQLKSAVDDERISHLKRMIDFLWILAGFGWMGAIVLAIGAK